MRRRLARVAAAVLALLAVPAALLVAAALTTSFDEQPLAWVTGPQAERGVPGWTRPCWRAHDPEGARDPLYTLPCGRVSGRVLFRQGRDPDGDGDAHLVVLAGTDVVVVKYPRELEDEDLPGIGGRVEAVGTTEDGPFVATNVRVEPPGAGARPAARPPRSRRP